MFANLMNRLGGTTSQMQSLNVQELNDWLKENKKVVLLDVRSADEYNHHGRISKSKLIPLDLLSQRLSELKPEDTIICVCRSGNRSSFACDTLQRAGFTNVYNLTGGMIAWERAGYKVTR